MAEAQSSLAGEWRIHGSLAESSSAESLVELIEADEGVWNGKSLDGGPIVRLALEQNGEVFDGTWMSSPQEGRFRGQELV